jgi:serine/threonine-protein kinase
LVVRDDAAIAYVCDGQRVEAWLKGSAADRKLVLSPAKGTASLRGKYDKGSATGSVLIGRKRWTFHIAPVTAPSGLYRAAQQLRGARVVGGWIVLASGEQVGIVTTDSLPTSAPTLNTSTGQVMIGDTTVTPTPIDGTTGSGF